MNEPAGASCVYATIGDTAIGCTVHCCYWPCERDGQPADPTPVHVMINRFPADVDAALDYWMVLCGAQRPLWMHYNRVDGESRHSLDSGGACWCAPHLYAPQQPVTRVPR